MDSHQNRHELAIRICKGFGSTVLAFSPTARCVQINSQIYQWSKGFLWRSLSGSDIILDSAVIKLVADLALSC